LYLVARPINLARVEHHYAPADWREEPVNFEGFDGFSARNDSLERGAEFGNVPLSVAELIELPADRILWRDCECVAKRTVCEADGEIGLEHEKALADRLHEIPRVNFAQRLLRTF
jgi:hypothetical protein